MTRSAIMPLSQNEAADALRDISQTERRSAKAYGYHMMSPHLFLWGAIWLAEYAGFYFNPQLSWLFSALSLAGVAGSFLIAWWMKRGRTNDYSWRYGATLVAAFFFVTAFFTIFHPSSDKQVGAFFPLLVALLYVLMGIWGSAFRMGVTGAALGVITLVGYFYFPATFMLWMGLAGGGALMLGGLWMRSV
jgi:hypothetical protein